MGKNLTNRTGVVKAASDSTPSGMKEMDPAPGGGKVRDISGPSVNSSTKGGNLKAISGVDAKTTVISK